MRAPTEKSKGQEKNEKGQKRNSGIICIWYSVYSDCSDYSDLVESAEQAEVQEGESVKGEEGNGVTGTCSHLRAKVNLFKINSRREILLAIWEKYSSNAEIHCP